MDGVHLEVPLADMKIILIAENEMILFGSFSGLFPFVVDDLYMLPDSDLLIVRVDLIFP